MTPTDDSAPRPSTAADPAHVAALLAAALRTPHPTGEHHALQAFRTARATPGADRALPRGWDDWRRGEGAGGGR
ncbi:hypothetical protein ACIQPQ_05590 [Streptomyces sp. NPDC091281]|uniref:hypothetical protein n=1 Tax=Streptomyces sp. NPDC091281 TaxID=3365985 RepID=UPI0037F8DF07